MFSLFTGVCLSVCFFPHDVSKTDAARITELDIEMLHDESWKSGKLFVLGSRVAEISRRGSLHSCECWLLLVSKDSVVKSLSLIS